GQRLRARAADWGLVHGRGRDRDQVAIPGPFRSAGGRSVSWHGLERLHGLRYRYGVATDIDAVVYCRRWHALQFRGDLSYLAPVAFPERDLALFRADGCGLPLYRRARSDSGLT